MADKPLTTAEQAFLNRSDTSTVQRNQYNILVQQRDIYQNQYNTAKMYNNQQIEQAAAKAKLDEANKQLNNLVSTGVADIAAPGAAKPGQVATTSSVVSTKTEPVEKKTETAKEELTEDDFIFPPEMEYNVLHQYASYTYGISLHLIDKDTWNNVILKQPEKYVPKNVLIASAGRHNNTDFVRNKFFSDDFYFDNLNITTVVGLEERVKNTNAIKIDFTIIEPYGMTLIDRILEVAAEDKIENYLKMPYLLQLDFYGSDDSGNLSLIPGITKRLPITLLTLKARVDTKGANYQISAVPFNHQAYAESVASVPLTLEVTAGTVGDFFKSEDNVSTGFFNNRQLPDGTTAPTSYHLSSTKGYKVESLASAVNKWYSNLKDQNKISSFDEIAFDIHPDIAKAKLKYSLDKLSLQDVAMPSNGDSFNSAARNNNIAGKQPAIEVDRSARTYNINAGTTIDSILSTVIRNSEFITNQIVMPEDFKDVETYKAALAAQKDKTLKWFKITTTVELKEFDNITQQWARKITYQVQPYTVANVKVPFGPQKKVPYPAKRYQYMYTGNNNDIINFDIEFNTAYFTALNAYRGNNITTAMVSGKDVTDETSTVTKIDKVDKSNPNRIMPQSIRYDSGDKSVTTTSDATTNKENAVADMQRSIMTTSRGDMITVKLKIIGDPVFIKQDDMFYNNSKWIKGTEDQKTFYTPNGSILMDRSEVYVHLSFRTPSDIDETNGLPDFNTYQQSSFSGMYKVITVDSEFRNGQFTQDLNLVRLFVQESTDYKSKDKDKKDSNVERGEMVPGKAAITEVPAPMPKIFERPEQDQSRKAGTVPSAADSIVSHEQTKLMELNQRVKTAVPITTGNEPQLIPPILKAIK